jgi:hypothetical protein
MPYTTKDFKQLNGEMRMDDDIAKSKMWHDWVVSPECDSFHKNYDVTQLVIPWIV